MTKYSLENFNSSTKFIDLEAIFDVSKHQILELGIARWRPARYDFQFYAQYLQNIHFFDENDNEISYAKLNADTWIFETKKIELVKVKYSFYANQNEAGGTFVCDEFILINPINCLFYDLNNLDSKIELYLKQDFNSYKIACGTKNISQLDERHLVEFKDIYEAFDTPMLLSKNPKQINFEVPDLENNKIEIDITLVGENKLYLEVLKHDFSAFISKQVEIFKSFPVDYYHFLCILEPDFMYHGVEHQNSSVNIYGSSFKLFNEASKDKTTPTKTENYKEFLGICCHEFFHSWNIKSIRPTELLKYNYTKEHIFETGYVAEGFTTYYGDLILYRAGLIDLKEYAKILANYASIHNQNYGKYIASMHESSNDLWLDGYKKGIPDDKVSIYTEGCLQALILDYTIQKITNKKASLDNLLLEMFHEFGHHKKGYQEMDLVKILNQITGTDFSVYFKEHFDSKVDLIAQLSEAIKIFGLELELKNSDKIWESQFGFKLQLQNPNIVVAKILPFSSSYNFLELNDVLISVNQHALTALNHIGIFEYFTGESVELCINRNGKILNLRLIPDIENGFKKVEIKTQESKIE